MAYISLIADLIGLSSGIYFLYIGGSRMWQSKKRKSDDEDQSDSPDQK